MAIDKFGQNLSRNEMQNIVEMPYLMAPCDEIHICENGKTISCRTEVPGHKCMKLQVQIGSESSSHVIGIQCGSQQLYCSDSAGEGSGSGGEKPEVPNPDPEPVIPPGTGSGENGGDATDPSVSAQRGRKL